MAALETVKIEDPKNKGDFVTINRADFDPEKHTEFAEKSAASSASKSKATK